MTNNKVKDFHFFCTLGFSNESKMYSLDGNIHSVVQHYLPQIDHLQRPVENLLDKQVTLLLKKYRKYPVAIKSMTTGFFGGCNTPQ